MPLLPPVRTSSDAGAFFDWDGDLLDDFEAKALEGGDVHRGVRQEPNALDAEVGEDLAAEADSAKDAAGAGLGAFAGAQLLVEDEAGGWLLGLPGGNSRAFGRKNWRRRSGRKGRSSHLGGGGFDLEAARGVVQVEDDAAAGLGDDTHGLVENFAAAAVGEEDVACGAARVHANEDGMRARRTERNRRGGVGRLRAVQAVGGLGLRGTGMDSGALGAEVAADERDVALAAVDLAFVSDHAEFAVAGLDAALAGANDVALVAQAVANELGDGEHLEAVLAAEGDEVGDAGHLAVVAHDFADDAGGGETGEAREIHRGLGLAGTDQHA